MPRPRLSPESGQVDYRLRVSKHGEPEQTPDGATAFGRYLAGILARSTIYANSSDFARQAGVSPSSVSRWISGKERPTPRILEKIAPKLGIDIRDLVALAYPESMTDPVAPVVAQPHRLAVELDRMLAGTSPISEEDRATIETFIDRFLEPYRSRTNRRRSA